MACGTPVIVSDISVYHEVAGVAGLYFEPSSPAALAEQLLRSLGSEVQTSGRTKALAQAGIFSWDKAAKQYKNAYFAVA
jgi:glycosyltransferase involved in cell wall biosynthesis